MKKLCLLTVFSLLTTVACFAQQAQWTDVSNRIIPTSGTPDLSDVCFIGNEGWVTSSNLSEFYYTADGGETFTAHPVPDLTFFNSISMRTSMEGYAAAENGFIYRSTDGGITWSYHGDNLAPAKSVSYRSPLPGKWGYACGDDGANSCIWPEYLVHILPVGDELRSTDCPEGNGAWICGQNFIFRFAGGQIHLDQVYPDGDYNAVYMVNNLTGWAGGADGIIIHTSDGLNWTQQVNPDALERAVNDLYLLNETEGWAVGTEGLIVHTTDGGTNWTVEGTGITSKTLKAACFTSTTSGYAVGVNKTLLRYNPFTGIGDPSSDNPFHLRVFPNPVQRFAYIGWQVPSGGQGSAGTARVILKINDFTGREVGVLSDEERDPGEHQLVFDAKGLPPGIYTCRLDLNGQNSVVKIIILSQ